MKLTGGSNMSLPYNNKLIPYAKELRKNATPWERKLWFYFLKDYNIRFQRQKAIGNLLLISIATKPVLLSSLTVRSITPMKEKPMTQCERKY